MRQLTKAQLEQGFNEWMRRFTEDPAKFEAQHAIVDNFLSQASQGRVPSYGEQCTALLLQIIDELECAPTD